MTKEIIISDGTSVIVDKDDYEFLTQWKWSANGNGYAVRNERYAPKKYRKQYLHRLIIGAKKGEIVDHINGSTLDNRKQNLRICNSKENARNIKGKRRIYSKYKGVTYSNPRRKWVAQIQLGPINKYLGGFDTEVAAAKAYNAAAIANFGDFARVNIIEEENK